jgi:3-deoxy-7-phosphoheptulonate synthase
MYASAAAGADGFLIEVHPDPENAMVDGAQTLNFSEFEAAAAVVRKVAASIGRE